MTVIAHRKIAAYVCVTCRTVLVSRHSRQFSLCACGNYVDGGPERPRIGGNVNDLVNVSVSHVPAFDVLWVGALDRVAK